MAQSLKLNIGHHKISIYRNTPNLVTATEPGTKIKFSGLVAVTKCLWGGGVKFRLLGRPKTRKSRFLGLFYDLFCTRYKYRNYCSYFSKYWLLSKTNKCNRFLKPIIIQTHIFKVINYEIKKIKKNRFSQWGTPGGLFFEILFLQ